MKPILTTLWKFFESMGEARAAAYLARQGKIIQAKAMCKK